MRFSLTLLSMAFMLSIGCGQSEDGGTATADPASAAANTASNDAPAENSESADPTTTTLVSLELPGMT